MDWRVLITRPEPLASRWQTWLASQQVNACVVSVMALLPVHETSAREAIKKVVLDFDHYHKAIFVSQNAVHEAMRWLEDYWPALPVGIEYLAIGEATAAALAEYGIRAAALGRASGAMNSEALLQSPLLHNLDEQKVVIFRGVGVSSLAAGASTGAGTVGSELGSSGLCSFDW
ncbi:MAG TPA: uroporphyrinogen-III synthase [Cellvibrionaceae bacterium]